MRIKDLAKALGMSPTTVSHALNGRGRISAATREQVLRRAKELGYTPNPHAQQLVTGQSRIAALCHTNQDIFSDLFLVDLAQGVEGALRRRGYGMLLDTSDDIGSPDSLLANWVRSGAIDGVILVKGWTEVREQVEKLASPRTPFVVYGRPDEADLPYVGAVYVDLSVGIRQVAELLVSLGHQRIGFIGIREDDMFPHIFRGCLLDLGVSIPDELVVVAGFTIADGLEAARYLLSLPKPPTAIFARKDDLAIGALFAAAERGLQVPEDLSVVGHDDVSIARFLQPALTTVQIKAFEVGQAAVELLFELRENLDRAQRTRSMSTHLVVRESVAPPSKR